jgi:hypothetical protein
VGQSQGGNVAASMRPSAAGRELKVLIALAGSCRLAPNWPQSVRHSDGFHRRRSPRRNMARQAITPNKGVLRTEFPRKVVV